MERCVCGGEKRLQCPECQRFVVIENGKYRTHERCICTGSHLEYKNCPKSGKPVV